MCEIRQLQSVPPSFLPGKPFFWNSVRAKHGITSPWRSLGSGCECWAYGAAFAAARILLQGLPGKQAAIFKPRLWNSHWYSEERLQHLFGGLKLQQRQGRVGAGDPGWMEGWYRGTRGEETSQRAPRAVGFYFHLPVLHWVHGNTTIHFFFCFRKMSFTLSPACPDANFTSPSRDKWKNSWWKIWKALWPVLCGELSSKRVVPFIRRVTCSGCAKGQIKARKQPAPLGLVVTQIQSAALSSFFFTITQSHMCFS